MDATHPRKLEEGSPMRLLASALRGSWLLAGLAVAATMLSADSGFAATAPAASRTEDSASPVRDSDPIPFSIGSESALGFLFDSGAPVTNPFAFCGGCFAWSSTYYNSPTDFDLTARKFVVPSGSFATSFRIWWTYGVEGPYPNSANQGGTAADFSSITIDLYAADGPAGSPGTLVANLTGTWSVLDAPSSYREFTLDSPYVFAGTDYYASIRATTALPSYQATLLWLMCAPDDVHIDYENLNSVNGNTGGWAAYTTLNPCPDDLDFGLQVVGAAVPDAITLVAEPGCINAATPCRTVEFDFDRADTTPVRGYSVTFELDNLVLCGAPAQGPYLSNHCGGLCTSFHVIDHGGGVYTVDCAILGGACGPDTSGTLFSISVGSGGSDGVGTVEITNLTVRNCTNGPVPATDAGPVAIAIDTAPPVPIADLSSAQIKTGNAPSNRTGITVSFAAPVDAAEIEVYRAPFGIGDGSSAYPEYDDVGGVSPPVPSYPPAPPWVLTTVDASGETDLPPSRGYWYYAVYTKDECGNLSAVSNVTTGTLDYHLGDVSDGDTPGVGDNFVGSEDISLLGFHYGITLALNDPFNYLDVGPTSDGSVDRLPSTDNKVDFEDLILFAINFGEVSFARPASGRLDTAAPLADSDAGPSQSPLISGPTCTLVPLAAASPGDARYAIVLAGNDGRVQGLHTAIALTGFRIASVERGPLLETQTAPIMLESFERHDVLTVDAVCLGQQRALQGDGVVAIVSLIPLTHVGDPVQTAGPRLVECALRDVNNHELGGTHAAGLVLAGNGAATWDAHDLSNSAVDLPIPMLELFGAQPNPFSAETELSFRLGQAGPVELRITDVQGRLVDVHTWAASSGAQTMRWRATNRFGERLPVGIYMYELRAGASVARGKLSLTR